MEIAHFLNQVHAPLVETDKERFQCVWDVQNGCLCCEGPSGRYLNKNSTISGMMVKKALKTQFSKKAQYYGFNAEFIEQFNKHLISEEHSSYCVHHFTDQGFINHLSELTKRFEHAKARHFIEHSTQGVLRAKLPLTALFFGVGKSGLTKNPKVEAKELFNEGV